jgi:hypothetical protein
MVVVPLPEQLTLHMRFAGHCTVGPVAVPVPEPLPVLPVPRVPLPPFDDEPLPLPLPPPLEPDPPASPSPANPLDRGLAEHAPARRHTAARRETPATRTAVVAREGCKPVRVRGVVMRSSWGTAPVRKSGGSGSGTRCSPRSLLGCRERAALITKTTGLDALAVQADALGLLEQLSELSQQLKESLERLEKSSQTLEEAVAALAASRHDGFGSTAPLEESLHLLFKSKSDLM